MTQSSLHVAIIMDGNGRWAERRGLERTAGHRVGATAVRRVIEAALRRHGTRARAARALGIGLRTLYTRLATWGEPPEDAGSA